MNVFSVVHVHRMLLFGARGLNKQASVSRVASHHVSTSLLHPERSSIKPAAQRRHRDQPKAGQPDWERSGQGKAQRKKIPVLQWPVEGSKGEHRVSSELRRLRLEDFPEERPDEQTPALESDADQWETLFGISPVLLALSQGRRKAHKLFVKEGEATRRAAVVKVCEEAHRRGVQIRRVSKRDLDKMCSGRVHQGVCLQASPLSYLSDDSVSAARGAASNSMPLWLVLDRVQDPMNLGAILRSAYFLGVDRVASSLYDSCPLSPVVSKASSGVMEVFEVYGYKNLEEMVRLKVAQGWQAVGTVGAETDQSRTPITSCSHFRMTRPTLLLMGGEGEGLSHRMLSLCQTILTIPAGRHLAPGVESLNVSVATAILLHSLLHSRRSTTL